LGNSEKERVMFDSFVSDYCHLDGGFIFALLRRNANFISTSEIICTLWSRYCREYTRTHDLQHDNDAPKTIIVHAANNNETNHRVASRIAFETSDGLSSEKQPLTQPKRE
jgi:hypothetical protein